MHSRLFVAAFVTGLTAVVASQDQSPSFLGSSSELVVLPVMVLDKRGGGF
jgi:hypothetical protein